MKAIKGTISRVSNGAITYTYSFILNPSELARNWDVKWNDLYAPGTTSGQAMFVNVTSEQLDLKLYLAAHVSGRGKPFTSIEPDIAEISSWALPDLEESFVSMYEYTSPPRLIFSYGNRTWPECTVRSINIRETLHTIDLQPIIAEIDLKLVSSKNSFEQLKSYFTEVAYQRSNLLSGTEDTSKLQVAPTTPPSVQGRQQ